MRVDLLDLSGTDGVIQSVNNFDDTPPANEYNLVQNPGANANIVIKDLIQGTGITITDNGNQLTIDSSGIAGITQSNLGLGEVILSNPGTATSFDFKTLIAGTNVTLTPTANDLTINVATPATPDSDLENLGAGNAILATTGILPVTTTRNFKTLIAGSNITLTPTANDITIAATGATDTNIYNTSGSLTANRTFGFNNFNLTMNGTGNYLLNNTGTIGLGNASSTTVTIGRSSQTLALNSGTITATNLPNTTQTNVVGFDSASKQLTYFAASTLPNPNTGVYFSVLPSSNVALALGDNFITGLIDASANRCYNDGSINTGTGIWSMSFPQYVSVSIQLTLTSSNASYITPEYFSYGLYNIGTGNKDVSSHNFITTNSGSGQTFTFSNHFYFPGTQTYKFFINVSNITGTLSVYYPETRFAIQRY